MNSKMLSSDSISDIMIKSLDLISDESNTLVAAPTIESAASMLLKERRKQKAAQMDENFIPLAAAKIQMHNPLLEQIATTTVEKPTYWKASSAAKDVKNVPIETKKKQLIKQKGEEYKEKQLEKLAGRTRRKNRLASLNRMY